MNGKELLKLGQVPYATYTLGLCNDNEGVQLEAARSGLSPARTGQRDAMHACSTQRAILALGLWLACGISIDAH